MSTTTAKAIGTFHPIPLTPLNLDMREPVIAVTMTPNQFGFEGIDSNGNRYMADTKYWRFEPAVEATAVWDGKILPPAETVCEAMHMFNRTHKDWIKVKILYMGTHVCAFLVMDGSGIEAGADLVNMAFRPIKTPEQIETEEREAAIEAMLSVDDKGSLSRTHFCGLLYDANYRKQVAP